MMGFNKWRDVDPSIINSVGGFFSYEMWEELGVRAVVMGTLVTGVIILGVGFIDSI